MAKKKYVIYDERATYDEDKAACLGSTNTIKEARDYIKLLGFNAVIFKYDVQKEGTLINGTQVELVTVN